MVRCISEHHRLKLAVSKMEANTTTEQPPVPDAEDVIQVVPQKSTPGSELTMALQMESERSTEKDGEEKKEEEPTAAALVQSEEPVEEGQEALWVDDVKDIPGFAGESPRPGSSIAAGGKRSPRRWSSKAPSPRRNKSENDLQNHVFLPPKDPPTKPSPLETVEIDKQSAETKKLLQAAQKTETARKLLNQALSPHANVGSRDLLAQAAYTHATEARRLMEDTPTPEMEALLKDAQLKGQAEVSKTRQLQLHGTTDSKSEDEHASRARNLLEFILPDVDTTNLPKTTTSGPTTKSPDDISTLGFDNTYVGKGGSKDFDILSMSSLNEILDGPMEVAKTTTEKPIADQPDGKTTDQDNDASVQDEEKPTPDAEEALDQHPEFPVIKHRIVKEEAEKNELVQETEVELRKEPVKRGGAKRSGLFGSIFRAKSKDPNELAESAPKKTPPRKKSGRWGSRKSPKKEATPEPSRFVTTVLFDDGVDASHNEGIQDLSREIANIQELEKIKAIDEKTNKSLQDAIATDDTESLTSFLGVPIHGKEEKRKKEDKKGKAKGKIPAAKEVPEETTAASRKPRDFEKSKPHFVSAPKGDPAILTSKSWESLGPDEEQMLRKSTQPITKTPSEESVEGEEEDSTSEISDDGIDVTQEPPSPDTSMDESHGDRYTVATDDSAVMDRYNVPEEQSFEAFWNPCSPRSPTIVPAVESSSTMGAVVSSHVSADDGAPEKIEAPRTELDKYAQTPSGSSREDEIPSAPVVRETILEHVIADDASKLTAVSTRSIGSDPGKSNAGNRTPPKKKRLKRPGVIAGFFGRTKASPARKSKSPPLRVAPPNRSKATKTMTPTKPKSRRPKRKKETVTELQPVAYQAPPAPEVPPPKPELPHVETIPLPVQEEKIETIATGSNEHHALKENVPAAEEATLSASDGSEDYEDPLVAQIKGQMNRSASPRGMDPLTVDDDASALRRGIDP